MRYSTIVEKDDKTLLEIIDAEEIPYIQGCDTLVVNALRQQPHHIVGQLDVGGQLGIDFGMAADVVAGVDEPRLTGSNAAGKGDGLVEGLMDGQEITI